ncbi:MAG: MBL fold metallo-hydrolase [Gammaproteobacteria bacterium]|nr:MBL fold metallo-hydrolase [Gammaproteobacteria bacterium]
MFKAFKKVISVILVSMSLSVSCWAQEAGETMDDPEAQRVAPFKVFDNLYYVGAKWVSAWLLETDQGLILFDALYDDLTDLVIESIRELGFDPNDIRYLVVSHAHYDHIGGVRRFQEEFGAVVMMTDADWDMTEEPAIYREYPTPVRHLSVSDGSTLNLGRTRLRFMQTPGHTPGVLSTRFTVYDNGYPHDAFLFGGVGLNFSGVERTEMYINSVQRLMQLEEVEVNIPNHPESGEVFERFEMLKNRKDGDPHPFVDPESWDGWLEILLLNARGKLERERSTD